ncbi:hypothetical protein GF366_01600 [Candidatus Peregrinibacteria bacterium]|nr:hypothetical protein [Candidatus Peregrinibacteria bacterium]
MPRRDGTGPMGAGPMTGRGFGPCNKRFAGRAGYADQNKDDEVRELQNQKAAIEKRLKELK